MSVELAFLNQLKKRVPIKTTLLFFETKDWTAPFDCYGWVTLIGAGASGGKMQDFRGAATGGSAGGTGKKLVKFKGGETYTFLIGAGGEPVQTKDRPQAYSGNDGGDTELKLGAEVIFKATGGKGGNATAGNEATASGVEEGGIGIGGDINFEGGGSGEAYQEGGTYRYSASGGGAVGLMGEGFPSGYAYGYNENKAFSGGAAVGAKSPDVTATSAQINGRGASVYDLQLRTSNTPEYVPSFGWFFDVLGLGGIDESGQYDGGPGAGSCRGGKPGIFAGSSGNSDSIPKAGIGAGGGGIATSTDESPSGEGGDGLALVELFLGTIGE